jgi:O-antigen ligase/tetratricopeptide (TPR) repeat protein
MIKTNNVIKWLILVGLWAVLSIPFLIANSMYFPYIAGKNFTFRIIVEIIFALWVYLAFADKTYRPKFSWVLGTTTVFVVIMAVADFLAVAPIKAFFSNYERMDGWITLIHLLMYLLVFGSIMKTEKLWLWFFRSSLAVSLVMTVLVFREWITTGIDRVSVTLGNPIYVAVYFLFNFFFALVLLYKDVIVKKADSLKLVLNIFKDWLTYVYIVMAFLSVFGIWRTSTRGVILGLIGGLVVSAIIIAIFEKKSVVMRRTAIGGLVIIAVLVFGFLAIKNTNFVKNNVTLSRLAEISWSNVSNQGQARQYVWPMALKGFKEKPILGWGQDGFNYVFNKYYDPRMYGQEQWFDRAHDMPLDILVAGGALGLISYLSIFVAALWLIWKRREKLGVTDAALLVGVLAGYFFQNLFVFDNLTSYIFFFVVLSYLHSSDTDSVEMKEKEAVALNPDLVNYAVAPVLVILLAFSLYFFNVKPIYANTTFIEAMQLIQQGGTSNSIDIFNKALTDSADSFKKALSYNSFGDPEIREQLLNYTPRIVTANIDNGIKQKFYDLSTSEIKKQLELTPNDARYQLFAGLLFDGVGQYSYALPYLQKAAELSPNKQTIALELVKCLSYLGEKKQVLDKSKEIYNLDQDYGEAKMNYVAALILNGDDSALKNMTGMSTTTNDRVIQAYLINASEALKKGDKNGAVVIVNKLIKIDPAFKDEGQTLIDGIWKGTVKE